MSIRAMLANAEHTPLDDEVEYELGELSSGERVCAPSMRRRGNPVLRAYVTFAAVVGGSWAVLGHEMTLQEWLSSATAAITASMERKDVAARGENPVAQLAALDQKTAIPEPLPSSEIIAAPGSDAGVAAPKMTTAESSDEPAVQPLPPPVIDPADPYQKRALEVGLHPELSRVLLAKLTADDYRNAGIAIKTAIAKTADHSKFSYPQQRTPDLAVFEIKFVRGVAHDCRRYVVTVTKDRWSTTALPMEKCGVAPVRSANKIH
ncbi:MAG: hypothetical protein ACKVP4_08245 [Hyphomicrobium sp.]